MTELLLSVKPLLLKAFIYCFSMAAATLVAFALLFYQVMSVHIPGQEVIWGMKWQGYPEAEIAAAQNKHGEKISKLIGESELPLFGSGALLGQLSGFLLDAFITKARRDIEADREERTT